MEKKTNIQIVEIGGFTYARKKIGEGYWQCGYGKGYKKANVYMINGFAYAKDKRNSEVAFERDLDGYVMVNKQKEIFWQVSAKSGHIPLSKS